MLIMTPLQALEVCARAAAEAADECSRISRQAAHAAATQAAAAKTPRAVEEPAVQDGSKIQAAHWVRRMLARQVISQTELSLSVMKAKELKTKISHTHSLILSLVVSLASAQNRCLLTAVVLAE